MQVTVAILIEGILAILIAALIVYVNLLDRSSLRDTPPDEEKSWWDHQW